MVAEKLTELCDTVDGCDTAAFADISTKMVLVSVPETELTRDAWNEICLEAALTMEVGRASMKVGYLATEEQTKVFIRSQEEPNDLLICLCKPTVDLGALIASADTCLADIAAHGS